MKVKALKDFSCSYAGNVAEGQVFELPDGIAIQMQEYGLIELIREIPQPKKSSGTPSSVSPADQASHLSRSRMSKENAESSESTQPDSDSTVTSSTLSINRGGSSTTKKRKEKKGGRGTKKPR